MTETGSNTALDLKKQRKEGAILSGQLETLCSYGTAKLGESSPLTVCFCVCDRFNRSVCVPPAGAANPYAEPRRKSPFFTDPRIAHCR